MKTTNFKYPEFRSYLNYTLDNDTMTKEQVVDLLSMPISEIRNSRDFRLFLNKTLIADRCRYTPVCNSTHIGNKETNKVFRTYSTNTIDYKRYKNRPKRLLNLIMDSVNDTDLVDYLVIAFKCIDLDFYSWYFDI